MNIFHAIFGNSKPHLPRMVATVSLYYSRKGIFVAPQHRDITGWTFPGDPMVLLALESTVNEIGNAVIDALRSVRDGFKKEDGERETAAAMEMMHEVDWAGVDKHWDQIYVEVHPNGNTMKISAMDRYPNGGFRERPDQINYEWDVLQIGYAVRSIIDGRPPKMQHDPSKT